MIFINISSAKRLKKYTGLKIRNHGLNTNSSLICLQLIKRNFLSGHLVAIRRLHNVCEVFEKYELITSQ